MNHTQAQDLAADLFNEADKAGLSRLYRPVQAANSDVWAVEELEGDFTIQIWVSPDLSFPL